jgi:hypothetical protein
MQPSGNAVHGRIQGRCRVAAVSVLATLAMTFGACAPIPPLPGQLSQDALVQWGPPSARYSLAAGGERLEYATGPYGRTTWMIDIDNGGRVLQARQVLSEAEFAKVQHAVGLTGQDLLRWLGRPSERRGGGWAGGEVWSWRYPTLDCRWFQVSLSDAGLVTSSAYAEDPMCEVVNDTSP